MSAHQMGSLFACKQVLYSEPFRSVQEIKVLSSFGHSVKITEVAMAPLSGWNQKTHMDLRPAYVMSLPDLHDISLLYYILPD